MNDKFFLDTNVFVYSFDKIATVKAELAENLIGSALDEGKGVVSYQVIQEFFSVAYRRFPEPMRSGQDQEYLSRVFRPLCEVHSSPALFAKALQVFARFRLQWYDALIVAAAMEAKCRILYTEDFQHEQKFDDLEVRNPFL